MNHIFRVCYFLSVILKSRLILPKQMRVCACLLSDRLMTKRVQKKEQLKGSFYKMIFFVIPFSTLTGTVTVFLNVYAF